MNLREELKKTSRRFTELSVRNRIYILALIPTLCGCAMLIKADRLFFRELLKESKSLDAEIEYLIFSRRYSILNCLVTSDKVWAAIEANPPLSLRGGHAASKKTLTYDICGKIFFGLLVAHVPLHDEFTINRNNLPIMELNQDEKINTNFVQDLEKSTNQIMLKLPSGCVLGLQVSAKEAHLNSDIYFLEKFKAIEKRYNETTKLEEEKTVQITKPNKRVRSRVMKYQDFVRDFAESDSAEGDFVENNSIEKEKIKIRIE